MDREYTQDTTIYAPYTSLFLYTLTPLQMSSLQVLLTNHQGCKYLYHRTEQQSSLPVCQAQYSSLQIHTLYQIQSIAAAQREQGISEYVGVCEQKRVTQTQLLHCIIIQKYPILHSGSLTSSFPDISHTISFTLVSSTTDISPDR